MTRKGKKKKQQAQGEVPPISTASTSEQQASSQQQQQQQPTQQTLQQQQKKKPQQTQDLSHQQLPQQAASLQQQQSKEQTQASGSRQQVPSSQQVTQQQAQHPQQQQPPSQQQAWGPRQKISPAQQAQVPRQQQPPSQQQAWGPRQQIPPAQQAQGPRQQPPPSQQQAWGPRQQIPLAQQAQGSRQQPPPMQQQAWGPRQQIPPSQQVTQQQAQGPCQQQPPPQQQAQGPPQQQLPPQQQAWGPRQQTAPAQQAQSPRQQQPPAQQQAWGPRQQTAPAQQAQSSRQQQPPAQQQAQGPPQQQPPSQQQAWGPRQQIPPSQQVTQQQGPWQQQPPPQQQAWGPPQQQPPPQQQAWGPRQQIAPAQQAQSPRQQQPPAQQQAWGPRQQIPPGQQAQGSRQQQPPSQQPPSQQQAWGPSQQQPQQQMSPRQAPASPSVSQLSTFSQLTTSDTPKPSGASKKPKSELKQCQLTIPQRPNLLKAGTLGKPIRVLTNMFEIKFHPNFVTNAVHYDIDIFPIASKSIHRKVFEECRKCYFSNRFPAYDGKKNAYSANNLPFNDRMSADIQIFDVERGKDRSFNITFTKVADVDLSWIKNLKPGIDEANRDQTGIQVLDIIMRHAPASRLLPLGRSFFSPATPSTIPKSLGRGVTLHVGPFSSAILGWKPYVNIDVTHKGFATPQLVITLMKELSGKDTIHPEAIKQNEQRITKFLTGLKVDYEVPNQSNSKRTYRINGLGPNAREIEFEYDESVGTVEEFFKQKKNYKLQWPTLPCLWVGSQTKEQKTYLPAELCKIVDGQPIKKLDEYQTSAMIKFAATDTFTRRNKISEAFSMIDVNNSDTLTNEFHLSVDGRMKEVEARILPAPQLQYSQTTATVNKGVWRPGVFNQAVQLRDNTWTILNLNRYLLETHLHPFVKTLTNYANSVGMFIGKPLTPFQTMRSPEQDIREITNYFHEKKNLQLIIVVLPDRTDRAYSKVKQVTELQVGVLTQCIKTKTLTEKCNEQTIKNILLKINSKLNGINHTFTNTGMPFCLRNANCMLVGADVSHPSPDARNIPSIAAVAASHDEAAFQYNVEVKLQEPKKEMIVDFEDIILRQIVIYNTRTGKLPTRIIFYRDGVSEGQLSQVMYYEVCAIRRACARIAHSKPKFKPEITCLVVQKRHHVRLFPTNKQESDDRNVNVKAGTIVDKEITHPNHIDFYLVSHASVQGTAKPTKYRCICNESNFNEDQIEQLTYYLCHMFARCTRSVSYPAPTYYAHLAAYRGRAWIQEVPINMSNLADEQRRKLDVKMARTPMFSV